MDALKKGGPVYDVETKEYIGEIVDVRQEPHMTMLNLQTGERREVLAEGRYDAIVTVSFDGNVSDKGYYTASNRQMSAGGTVGINSKFAQCWSTIEKVWVEEEK